MNDGRLRTTRRLARAIMALLAILAIGFAPIPAHAAEAPGTAGAFQTVTGRRTVSVASNGRGLALGLLEGDRVEVRGNTATISDTNGSPVATIEAEPPQGYKVAYDAHHRYLTVVSTSPFRARGCTSNKWAQWLVGAAANGMVCVPLGIGVGGLTGGVGGSVGGRRMRGRCGRTEDLGELLTARKALSWQRTAERYTRSSKPTGADHGNTHPAPIGRR